MIPSYHPELYDDCRDAFGGFSAAGLRSLLGGASSDLNLGDLADDDVRAVVKLVCLGLAMGFIEDWGDLPPIRAN